MIKTAGATTGWKALYFYHRGRQVGHIGVDPGAARSYSGGGPKLFLAVPWQQGRGGYKGLHFCRWTIPHLAYRHEMGRLRRWIWKHQERFWHSLDTRYR